LGGAKKDASYKNPFTRVPADDASAPSVTDALTTALLEVIKPGGDRHETAVFDIHLETPHAVSPTLMLNFEFVTPKLNPVIVAIAPPLVGRLEEPTMLVTTGASYRNAELFRYDVSRPL